tara:strand:- start:889 stop:1431 length:543 start_codon:yes stop_codon:yes gene_type:complete
MKRVIVFSLVIGMLGMPVGGVAQNQERPLRGITKIYPIVSLTISETVPQEQVANYEREIEDAFELGLLRAGIELIGLNETDPERIGPVVLGCSAVVLLAAGIPGARDVYMIVTEEVKLQETGHLLSSSRYMPESLPDPWLVTTWKIGPSLRYQPLRDFTGSEIGRFCAEQFVNDWRRGNN